MHNPPDSNQGRQPNSNHARIVHRIRKRGKTVWEAVNNERNHDIEASNRIDSGPEFTQPERTRLNVFAAREKMRKDSQKI